MPPLIAPESSDLTVDLEIGTVQLNSAALEKMFSFFFGKNSILSLAPYIQSFFAGFCLTFDFLIFIFYFLQIPAGKIFADSILIPLDSTVEKQITELGLMKCSYKLKKIWCN